MNHKKNKILILFIVLLISANAPAQDRKLDLTPQEASWIRDHETVRVGISPVFPPLKFSENGVIKGVEPDYLHLLAELTGIDFQYVVCDSSGRDLKVQSFEIDMFLSAYIPERLTYMMFTEPLMDFRRLIITRNDAPFMSGISALRGKKVAIAKGVKLYIKMLSPYPDIETVEVGTMEEQFKAVSESEADALISSTLFAGYSMQNYPNLKIAGIADIPSEPYLYAVRKDYPELVSILNKAIASITRQEHNEIFQKWCNVRIEYRPNWSEILKWVFAIGTFFIIILGISLYWNRRLSREMNERKLAENELRESGERYRKAQSLGHVGNWEYNIQTTRFWGSDEAKRIYGFDVNADNFTTDEVENCIPEREMVHQALVDLIEKDKEYNLEFDIITKDTEKRKTIFSIAELERDEAGRPLKITGVIQDITERKLAEDALRESEERLALVLEGSQLGFWDWNISTGEVQRNNRWAEMLGYTLQEIELSVRQWTDLIHPDDRAVAWQSLQDHLEGRKATHKIEYRMLTKDGEWKWILDHAKIVKSDTLGQPVRMSGTHTDITDSKRAEDALNAQKKELQTILDAVPALIYYKDLENRIIRANRLWFETLGLTEETIVGKKMSEYLPEEIADGFYKEDVKIVKTGNPLKNLQEILELENETRYFLTSKYPHRNAEGDIIGIIGFSRDITFRKKAEDALKAAKEAAESATLAKSEFLANMSHEIRTPMNAIVNMTRLLLDTPLDKEQRDFAETAMASSEILLSLINDILDFSKIEAGKLELESTDFSLTDTVGSVVRILEAKAGEKGLRLTHSIATDVHPYLRGDPVRVRQILLNFTNNAVKFTEKGGIEIRVSSESQTDTHTMLKFSVTDTGIGIPKAHREKLFKSFSQTDASTTRKYGGTGLGLAISKQLAELMGGEVGVESEEGKGSTFWFTPVFDMAQGAGLMAQHAGRGIYDDNLPPATCDLQPAPCRILLAEDNIPNQKVALAILKKFGLSADIANNGREALELLRKTPYDLVLMDMQMPVTDGLEATRIIRDPASGMSNPDVPIVAMTANSTQEDRKKCAEAGMNDYITKPINPNELLAVIYKTLKVSEALSVLPEEKNKSDNASLTTDNASEIFDYQEFLDRLGGDEELAKSLIKELPTHLTEKIKALKAALDEKDSEKIIFHAHAIKGMCANMSAKKMADAAHQIEIEGKEDKTDMAYMLTEKLEHEYEILQSVLLDMFPDIFQTPPES